MQRLFFTFLIIFSLFSKIHCLTPNASLAASKSDYKFHLTICSIFYNEAQWIKEWIEFHKLVGVEHFVLYNNESTDDYLSVLAPYLDNYEVTLIQWPNRSHDKNISSWVYNTQIPAYLNCAVLMQGVSKWVAFIDCDEFIVPRLHDNLIDFLCEYESDPELGGLTINWDCYGTSNILDVPEGNLMIESLIHREHGTSIWSRVVKTIAMPEFISGCNYPHLFQYQPGKFGKNPCKQKSVLHQPKCINSIKINHYYARTLNYFYKEKLIKKRQMDNRDLSYSDINEYLHRGNERMDTEKDIFRFVPALREKLKLQKANDVD